MENPRNLNYSGGEEEISGDDHAHDLVGALEDHVHAAIAHILLNGVVFQVAVSAVYLQRLVAYLEALLGGEHLGHAAQRDQVLVLRLEGEGGIAHKQTASHEIGGHVGELELQVLELIERLVELLARVHVVYAGVQAGLRGAQATARYVYATAVQASHGYRKTLALLAYQIAHGHFAILHNYFQSNKKQYSLDTV